MRRQVVASLVVGAVAVVVLALVLGRSSTMAAAAIALVGLGILGGYGWWSLRKGRHTPWAQAEPRIAPGHAVVLRKPGCPYCERLRALADDPRITWVSVWQDPAAQRRTCELNDGNEYTPTALVGPTVLRNPPASELRAALTATTT